MTALAGIVAGLLEIVAIAPYIRDILRGSTRPHRASWAMFVVLGIVGTVSQFADGATWSLVLVAAQTASSVVVFVLAIRRGVGGGSRIDVILLGIAGLGVVGWAVSSDPTVATACVVLADAIAVAMMLPKTHRDPWSETASSFAIGLVATVFAILSVGSLDPALMLYPVFVLLGSSTVLLVIVTRRRTLRTAMA